MGRPQCDIIQGHDSGSQILKALGNRLLDRVGIQASDHLRAILAEDGVLADRLVDTIVAHVSGSREKDPPPLTLTLITKPVTVPWDQHKNWQQAVDDTGIPEDNRNRDITEKRFSLVSSPDDSADGQYDLALAVLNRATSIDEVKKLIKANRWQRPSFGDGLAFAQKFPKEQRKRPIVIFCKLLKDSLGCWAAPCLHARSKERAISLVHFEGDKNNRKALLVRVPRNK